jgi:hypothetical protein
MDAIRQPPTELMSSNNTEPAKADVYAGDTANPTGSRDSSAAIFLFSIEADAEPDVFARVANLFNLANLAPLWVTLRRIPNEHVNISVQIGPLSLVSADMISRKISQLTCVSKVILQTAMSPPGEQLAGC